MIDSMNYFLLIMLAVTCDQQWSAVGPMIHIVLQLSRLMDTRFQSVLHGNSRYDTHWFYGGRIRPTCCSNIFYSFKDHRW